MRALAALAALALFSACAVCERATAADGVYPVTSDCAGRLVKGSLTIGGLSSGSCFAGDAGTHHGVSSVDGGPTDAGTTEPACVVQTAHMETWCPETAASGAQALGLPSHVRVNGPSDFELYGEVNGRTLSCTPASFGDEQILFCREADKVVCAAAIGVR